MLIVIPPATTAVLPTTVSALLTPETFSLMSCVRYSLSGCQRGRKSLFNFPSTVSPEIEVERGFIHTGVGYEAQLTCLVHSEPPANIVWYKDTTQLGTTDRFNLQVQSKQSELHPALRLLLLQKSFNSSKHANITLARLLLSGNIFQAIKYFKSKTFRAVYLFIISFKLRHSANCVLRENKKFAFD